MIGGYGVQAFWPSLQVLAGEIPAARASHRAFHSLWREFQALPEIFDARGRQLISFARDSPLRPEFVESTYHLYMATRDPHYLQVGKDILFSLQNRTRVPCGFASIADVTTHRLDDRMDSFFLTETLKYLYLLFDNSLEAHEQTSIFCPLGVSSSNGRIANGSTTATATTTGPTTSSYPRPCIPYIRTLFTTEGHIFFIESAISSAGKVNGTKDKDSRLPGRGATPIMSPSKSQSPNAHGSRVSRTCAAVENDDMTTSFDDPPTDTMVGTEAFGSSTSFRVLEEEAMKIFRAINLQGVDAASANGKEVVVIGHYMIHLLLANIPSFPSSSGDAMRPPDRDLPNRAAATSCSPSSHDHQRCQDPHGVRLSRQFRP